MAELNFVLLNSDEWPAALNNCSMKSLCRSRYPVVETVTGHPSWNTSAVDDDVESLEWCRCDPRCGEFGDCCLDASTKYGVDNSLTSSWKCLPMTAETDRYTSTEKFHMYMIASCPNGSSEDEDESVATLCQHRKDFESGHPHLADVPVLSLATNRTYANVYCAQCHSDFHRLAQWNTSIYCNEDPQKYGVNREQMFHRDNYRPGTRSWILHSGHHPSISCVIVIDQLRDSSKYLKSTGGRRCASNKNNCATDWTNAAEGYKCGICTLYMETPEVSVNPHCAVCSNDSSNDIDYFDDYSLSNIYSSNNRNLYSFSIIMDLNFGGGIGAKRCKSNEIFDHLHELCHVVSCGSQFVKEAETCVPRLLKETGYQPDNSSSLNSSCPRLILKKDVDYHLLSNGSVVVNKTNVTLHPIDYELDQNDTIQICAELTFLTRLKNYLKHSYPQRFLSDVCLTISVICLALHIIIHIVAPKLRNLPGKNLLSLSCCLFVGQLLFLTGVGAKEAVGYELCAAIGIVIHWSILAAFFWMNIMGFDICRTFAGSKITNHRHRASVQKRRTVFFFYSIYGWTSPSLIVGLSLVLDFTDITDGSYAPNYGVNQCWICNQYGLGFLFILPMATLLTVNFLFFGLTAWSIFKQWKEARFAMDRNGMHRSSSIIGKLMDKFTTADQVQQLRRKRRIAHLRTRFFLYVKLALIMGLGWISGLVAGSIDVPGLWYPFILFNTLQGTFIFLAFDCKWKIYYTVYEAITKRTHPSNFSSSTRGYPNANKAASSTPATATNTSSSMHPEMSTNTS